MTGVQTCALPISLPPHRPHTPSPLPPCPPHTPPPLPQALVQRAVDQALDKAQRQWLSALAPVLIRWVRYVGLHWVS